jgi:hypothetical protein
MGAHPGTWLTLSKTAIGLGSGPRGHIVMMMRRRCIWPSRFLIWGRVWVLVEVCGSDCEILSARIFLCRSALHPPWRANSLSSGQYVLINSSMIRRL